MESAGGAGGSKAPLWRRLAPCAVRFALTLSCRCRDLRRMVTLRDIAERLGCTRSTVSYALRNRPDVAAETRAAVHKLARELGWKPNAELARHMALVRTTTTRRLPNLAIVLNKPERAMAEEHTPRLHLLGARLRAAELGYNADVFNLAEKPLSARRLRQVLRARGIKGIVYIATLHTTLPLEHLRLGTDFASAVVGIRYPELPYHVAVSDLSTSGHTAMSEICARGYRRPGAIIPGWLDRVLAWAFSASVYAGQLELQPENRVPTLHVGDKEIFIPKTSYSEIRNWLLRERPDALMTTDPRYLAECLAGTDLPFATPPIFALDFHPNSKAIGGIDQRQQAVGAAGLDLVVAQLHRGEMGLPPVQRTLQIEGVWRDAETRPAQTSVKRPARTAARAKR